MNPGTAPRQRRVGRTLLAGAVFASMVLVAGCGPAEQPASGPPSTVGTVQSTSATTATDTLAGRWVDEKSNVYLFATAGTNAYTGEVQTLVSGVCAPLNIKVSGTAGHYEGTMAFYQSSNSVCGAFLGDGTIFIDVSSGGAKAQVRWAAPGSSGNCLNCTPHAWTRS